MNFSNNNNNNHFIFANFSKFEKQKQYLTSEQRQLKSKILAVVRRGNFTWLNKTFHWGQPRETYTG